MSDITGAWPAARSGSELDVGHLFTAAESDFARYEVVKDLVDECIDLSLNYRQSGHPGGSRSKVHMMLALLLSGAMRWDLLRPWRRFGDRFVLSAGHTVPLVYATLAVLNEAVRARYERTGAPEFAFPDEGRWALTWEWLLRLRRNGGLPGHAEMEGRTLFLKFNTGPSGHGMPPAAGEALSLHLAGAGQVKVFVFEGEGGLTPGSAHETKNSAWGLGLDNLIFMVDWNDFGIDPRPTSSVVAGTPEDWFAPYGWRVLGTEHGMEWGPVTRTVLEAACDSGSGALVPTMAWFRTQKGRGYGKVDAASHGTAWPMNAEQFWVTRKQFMARYGVTYEGVDSPAPADPAAVQAQAAANLGIAMSVLRRDEELVTWLSDRLVAIADTVPDSIEGFRLGSTGLFSDRRIFDVAKYPDSMWKKPGEKAANRAGLSAWGAYVNTLALADYGRPLFIAASADLAESTNIAGFGHDYGGLPGTGWYERVENPTGALLPTEITEFTNAGMMVGLATVNLAADPFNDFDGYWGSCSTYGSFSYLKYGPIRLFSQLAQDCELKVGKLLWIAGHSGPETAEDSRTHFGIFSIGVTQLFPEGHVIDLHPWEYNEVPVLLGAAFALDVPVVALHLTRPPVEIPDREALGMPSHLAAARGAYVMREYRPDQPKGGTVFIRGTLPTANLVKVLPQLDARGINVRIVAAISPQLFARQSLEYRRSVTGPTGPFDSMVITNGAFKLMRDWADGPLVREYSLSSDWDDRWRTGGSVAEVIEEAHLDEAHILAALERFAAERTDRLRRLREQLDSA
jgi:transketolase